MIWEHNLVCGLGRVTNYHVLVLEGPGCFLRNPDLWRCGTEDFPPCGHLTLSRAWAGSLEKPHSWWKQMVQAWDLVVLKNENTKSLNTVPVNAKEQSPGWKVCAFVLLSWAVPHWLMNSWISEEGNRQFSLWKWQMWCCLNTKEALENISWWCSAGRRAGQAQAVYLLTGINQGSPPAFGQLFLFCSLCTAFFHICYLIKQVLQMFLFGVHAWKVINILIILRWFPVKINLHPPSHALMQKRGYLPWIQLIDSFMVLHGEEPTMCSLYTYASSLSVWEKNIIWNRISDQCILLLRNK